jgi:elongation factor G
MLKSGKTTTTEQMLYICGATKSVGRVDNGDTVMDFLPQERERGITISSAAISFKWKDMNINLIDTPGHVDFTVEVERSMRVLDGAVIIVDAVAGVQAQTRTVWKQGKKNNISAIAFINKMDRLGASFESAIASLHSKLEANCIPIQIPLMRVDKSNEAVFIGVIDLISMEVIEWKKSADIRRPTPPTVYTLEEKKDDEHYEAAIKARDMMYDALSAVDDSFMTHYFELLEKKSNSTINPQIVVDALRRACVSGHALPVLCGTSLNGMGVEPLLNSISAFLPSPEERPPCSAINKKTNEKISLLSSNVKDLTALAFKVVHDNSRGYMVYVRSYTGILNAKNMLYNSTKGIKERPTQLLAVNADDLKMVESMGPGSIGCFLGLKSTVTGDTLVTYKGPYENYVLDGLSIPEAVYSLSIEPETSAQQDEMIAALNILSIEDPSLRVKYDEESGQTLILGIGELHLEIVCDKLKRRFGINVQTGAAYVSYRETLSPDCGAFMKEFAYDKITGTKRMYASIKAVMKPNEIRNENNIIVAAPIKKLLNGEEYFSLVDGINSFFSSGPAGYPITGVCIEILEVIRDADTTSGSIRACISMLADSMFRNSDRVLLEPVMSLEVELPDTFLGGVLSDLTVKRRATIKDILSSTTGFTSITGFVPLSEMMGYATSVRSATQGQGGFSMEYLEHQVVDYSVANVEKR